MVYYNNIPQSGDKPSQSQSQLASNFADLDTVFNDNHIGFSQASDRGEHRKVTFNSVIADPAESDPKTSLYIKTVAGDSELFYEKYDNAAAANLVQQLTNLSITNLVNGGTAGGSLYRIDSPLGFTIYCGTTNSFSGNRTVVFPSAYTTNLATQATAEDANVQKTSTTTTLTGLTLRTENNVKVNWLAIGII